MRTRPLVIALSVFAIVGCLSQAASVQAQVKAGETQLHGTLIQVMRGILLPASNVVFAVQADDPEKLVPTEETIATSPNPLALPRPEYGGWVAVENAGIAMAEAANLITTPGRLCSNGRPVPVDAAEWKKYVQILRDAGMEAYKAAKAKDPDAILFSAGTVTDACAACHDVYREKTDAQGGLKARCTAS